MMNPNPWRTLPHDIYEKHMGHENVHQLQMLSLILREQLALVADMAKPTVAVLGITGGNGLANVIAGQYKAIIGIDINEEYLEICRKRYSHMQELELHQLDLMTEKSRVVNILTACDLIAANLIIKHIHLNNFMDIVSNLEKPIVSITIQFNPDGQSLSQSGYEAAFEDIQRHGMDCDELTIDAAMRGAGFIQTGRAEHELPNKKMLIRLDYKRKNIFMKGRKIYGSFIEIEPITKGWSEDKKYCVTATDGMKYLLRVTPISRYEVRKSLFAMLEQVAALGVPMCVPVEFGTCEDNADGVGGVYSIQSWIDGQDLEAVLPSLSETEQYVLGLKSGEIIRKMHSIPAPRHSADGVGAEEWESRFNRKTDMKIQKYHECGLRFDGDEYVLSYIEQNRHLLKNRPQCFQHGDYHVGNMMLENGEKPLTEALKIIDFDRYDFGDPWEEFNRIVWSAAVSPHFATGQLRGYFGGEPPLEFFKLLAFYIASNTLSSIYWAVPFGPSDLDTMMKQAQDVLTWFDNMRNPVPTWYLKEFYIQWIDGVPYKLKAPFDFSFLNKYGKVFKVFDNQGSGCICFGVEKAGKRYFLKFAGARTVKDYLQNPEDAITRLKYAVPKYKDLKHPLLINLIDAQAIGNGFIAVFDWFDGESCGYPQPEMCIRFMALPVEEKLRVYEGILEFHAHVAKCGYVAIDFNDHATLYNFDSGDFVICDIDFYAKQCYMNGYSGIWGAPFLMSPEESRSGAVVDEISNVYAMGATAFAFFCDGWDKRDRRIEDWKLSKKLYDVAKQAVSDNRDQRQQSIQQLIDEWRAAKG